jgi:hypothetical protein
MAVGEVTVVKLVPTTFDEFDPATTAFGFVAVL